MSARKSFPKPKNATEVGNNDLNTASYVGANGPITVETGKDGTKVTHRKVSIRDSRPRNLMKCGEILPTVITIKQEDASMDEPAGPTRIPDFALLKPFEIKLEKTTLSELNKKGIISPKTKRLKNANATKASGSLLLPNGNTKSNITTSPKILSPIRFTPSSPKSIMQSTTKSNSFFSVGRTDTISKIASTTEMDRSAKANLINSLSSLANFSRGTSLSSPQSVTRSIHLPNSASATSTQSLSMKPLDNITGNGVEKPPISSPNMITPLSPKGLTPNDLRHTIYTRASTDNQSNDSEELIYDGGSDENLDSMSIHADDDDLLNDGESPGNILNSLGKHFSAINDTGASEKRNANVTKSKRKHAEEQPTRGKMQRLENSDKQIGPELGNRNSGKSERENRSRESGDYTSSRNQPASGIELVNGPDNIDRNSSHALGSRHPLLRHNENNFTETRSNDSNHRSHDPNHKNSDSNHKSNDSNHRNSDSNHRSHDSNHKSSDSNQKRKDHQNHNHQSSKYRIPLVKNSVYPNKPPHPLQLLPGAHPRSFRPVFPLARLPVHRPSLQAFQQQPPGWTNWGNRELAVPTVESQQRWAPPMVDRYRHTAPPFERQRSYENRNNKEMSRRTSTPCGGQVDGTRRSSAPTATSTHAITEQDATKKRMVEQLYHSLLECVAKQDFDRYIPICEEIMKLSDKFEDVYLESLLKSLADEGSKKADTKLISYVFDQIRKTRENTGLKIDDFKFAIEAYLKSEEIDEAIKILLEMKNNGFRPSKTLLKLIKSGFLEFSVKDIDCFIKFCDDLEDSLITEKLVEETLKFISPEDLKMKTKSTKILSILQDIKIETAPSQIPSVQLPKRVPLSPFDRAMEKITQILPSDNIPVELLVQLIHCINTSAEARSVLVLLQKIPKNTLVEVDSSVWNEFLTLASVGPYADVQVASQIEGIMKENHIRISNQAAFQLVCCMLRSGLTRPAVENLNLIQLNELSEEDLTDEIHDCLCNALQHPGSTDVDDVDVAERIIRILIQCKKQPPENKLLHLLSCFKDASDYQKIHNIVEELHGSNIQPSYEVYRLAFSALEFWLDNLDAVIELFAVMKRLYPERRLLDNQSHLQNQNNSSGCPSTPETATNNEAVSMEVDDDDDEKSLDFPQFDKKIELAGELVENNRVCEFFLAGEICPQGQQCSFSHMLPAPPLVSPFQANCTEEAAKPDSGYASTDSVNRFFAPPRPPSVEPLPANAEYNKYYNRMLFAANSEDYESLYRVYVDMRKRDIKIDDKILRTLYQSMVCETPSERFKQLSEIVKSKLPGILAIEDDDGDDTPKQLILLKDEDQENLGRLGVRLMIFCNGEGYDIESHRILHVFHALEINYCMFGLSFDRTIPHMSHCEVVVMAVDVCLRQSPPQIEDAVVVLNSANYGLPNDSGEKLTPDENGNRNRAIGELFDLLLNEEEFEQAFDLLKNCFNDDHPIPHASDRLNLLLLKFSESSQIENARDVFQFMENRHEISREALRAYLNCFADEERIFAARNVCNTGRSLGIYPTADPNSPYKLEIPSDLSRVEMLFVLEHHLVLTRTEVLIPKDAILPLPSDLTIKFTEVNGSALGIWSGASTAKENMTVVLKKMMNPALQIVDKSNGDSDICVAHSSVLNWYNSISDITEHRVNLDVSIEAKDTRRAVYKEPTESSKQNTDTTKTTSMVYCVSSRVKHYLEQNRVGPGQSFQKCCLKLTKLYKQYNEQKAEKLFGDDLKADINKFVDNFFEKHYSFK